MNKQQILEALGRLGLNYELQLTGSPRYERCFIKLYRPDSDIPISLGRITILDGKYDHTKWYADSHDNINEWTFYQTQWNYLLMTDQVLTRKQYDAALTKAQAVAQAKHDAAKQWRAEHPKKGGRCALSRPSPRGHLLSVLFQGFTP